jgi:hypothetical protein
MMEDQNTEPTGENPLPEELPAEPVEKKAPPYSVLSGFQTVLSIAIVMATLLTLWNPRKLLSTPNLTALLRASAVEGRQNTPQPEDTSSHIGILAGHWQDSPGNVCADGLAEVDVNQAIASRVAQSLTDLGYKVDIFPEFDLALLNYQSAVFIAIYSGSCADNPFPPSGFKISSSLTAANPAETDRLAICLTQQYQKFTGLPFSYEIINPDHPSYHIFRDIHANTPAVMIEVGSLSTDRKMIVGQMGTVSDGIVAGILCDLKEQSGDNQ